MEKSKNDKKKLLFFFLKDVVSKVTLLNFFNFMYIKNCLNIKANVCIKFRKNSH